MNLMTKENFWNEIEQRWPGEFQSFIEWIDAYKKSILWEEIFKEKPYFSTDINGDTRLTNIKFHHLPDAMQIGIFIQYTIEKPHHYSFNIEDPGLMENIIQEIKEWFCEEHSEGERQHIESKYGDMGQSDSDESFPGDSYFDDYYGR